MLLWTGFTSLAILKLLCKITFTDRRCPVENCAYVLPANFPLLKLIIINSDSDTRFFNKIYLLYALLSCWS